ncbi:MAG: DAK2 domain-containing protein [Clostridia bacterium]|nr:DAK2 domain-containing protein [Clostridia bacterium]
MESTNFSTKDTEKKTKIYKSRHLVSEEICKNKNESESQKRKKLDGFLLTQMVRGGADELRSNAEEVNRLNVFPVPDGDTGDNMSMTIDSGVAAIDGLNTGDLAEVMRVLSHGMLLGARGNSGVILSQFFAGVASGFENSSDADPKTLGAALELGVKQAYETVMTPTEGTILTVAREAVEYAVSKITPRTTIRSFFGNFVREMHASVERTPELLPALKEAGVVDSGGAGLFYIMDGFNRVLNGEKIPNSTAKQKKDKTEIRAHGFDESSEMTYAYCTETLVQLTKKKCDVDRFDIENLRSYLNEIGDSVATVKSGSIVKIHTHTYAPNKVLEAALKVGELISVKVENMSVQHSELDGGDNKSVKPTEEKAASGLEKEGKKTDGMRKKYGVVAVASGKGIAELFRNLGADETVFGGQTNNPSANDFLEAFLRIDADYIFVLPNNSNIFLAAEQAASMYEKSKVFVIKTKSIGTGYVALSCINFERSSPYEIIDEVEKTTKDVISGFIAPAIRDTNIDGFKVKVGDTIGVIDKTVAVCCAKRSSAALSLAKKMLKEKHTLTVFFGCDTSQAEAQKLIDKIKKSRPDREAYLIDSGQEIYPYIFIAE